MRIRNLQCIVNQNFVKLSQLEAYYTLHSYDLIWLSETWLGFTTSTDSNDLSLKCLNLHRVDNPCNVKNEGFVFIIKKP